VTDLQNSRRNGFGRFVNGVSSPIFGERIARSTDFWRASTS
jgi:hypothetical protein